MAANVNRRVPFVAVATAVVAMVSLVAVLAPAQAAPQVAKKVEVKFDAVGGKVGAKAVTTKKVTKGKEVGKLPVAKRAGYAFKGWFTKRSGGKKIAQGTKIRAKTTLYARWTRMLSAQEKKLVGDWSSGPTTPIEKTVQWIKFRSNGTFSREYSLQARLTVDYQNFWLNEGLWRVKGNQIIATKILESIEWHANNDGRGYVNKPIPDQQWTYLFDDKKANGLFAGEGFTWLRINHYPHRGGWDEYGLDYVKPIPSA